MCKLALSRQLRLVMMKFNSVMLRRRINVVDLVRKADNNVSRASKSVHTDTAIDTFSTGKRHVHRKNARLSAWPEMVASARRRLVASCPKQHLAPFTYSYKNRPSQTSHCTIVIFNTQYRQQRHFAEATHWQRVRVF